MATVTRELEVQRGDVWRALMDAERYPKWLIGAQEVDAPTQWPEPGSRFRHRIGVGPFTMPGSTTSREVREPDRFVLTAGMGLLGEAEVTSDLAAGDGGRTTVTMTEVPRRGLVAFAHRVARPLIDRLIDARNAVSLQELEELLAQPRTA